MDVLMRQPAFAQQLDYGYKVSLAGEDKRGLRHERFLPQRFRQVQAKALRRTDQ